MGNLLTDYPDLAAEWHPTRNGNLRPRDVTKGSNKKVWWICANGHEWEASVYNRVKGRGCPQCYAENRGKYKEHAAVAQNGSLADERPDLLVDWDYLKNDADPRDISKFSTRKVWWKCHVCGYEWQSAVNKRSRADHGCPACKGKAVNPGHNDLATVRPDIAASWHPTKNGELMPQDITAGSNKKVWWICEKGHPFQATVASRTNGSGCPYCSCQRLLVGFNDLATTRPDIASEWHPTKNGDLTPHDVMKGSHAKAWWRCPIGHSYKSDIANRSNGTGCPICDKENKTSFPEQALLYYLGMLTQAEGRYQYADAAEIDIYLPALNAGVEYDGYYWHASRNAAQSERRKDQILANAGVRLVRVKELERGASLPEDTTDVIYCSYSADGAFLESVIRRAALALGFSEENIASLDIDIERDRAEVYSRYIESVKANSLEALNPTLASQWDVERNGDLAPGMVSYGSGKIVWWKCAHGHSWQASVDSRRSGNGCPYCSGKRVLPGFNDLTTTDPDLAVEWHSTKNGVLTPQDVTRGSKRKIWWSCPGGHDYQATVANRSSGRGCPTCALEKRARSRHESHVATHDTLDLTDPGLCKEWSRARNGDLTPSDVTRGSSLKVWWTCPKGHDYQASIANRVSGKGCPYCSGKKVLEGFNDLRTVNPAVAEQWHPARNGGLQPEGVLAGSHKKAWWKCEKGHEWEAVIKSRALNGAGCPYCSNQKVLKGYNDLASQHPDIAALWDNERNGELRPDQVVTGSGKRVWWKCPRGHSWQAQIYRVVQSAGCPVCRKGSSL